VATALLCSILAARHEKGQANTHDAPP